MSGAGGWNDDLPVDASPKSSYLGKKEAKRIGLAVLLLLVVLLPVYRLLEANAQSYECRMNVGQIYKAINLYAEQNDDLYPPLYMTAVNPGPRLAPALDARGEVVTWASLVKDGMNERTSFKCPSAAADENVKAESGTKTPLESSYGMFAPYGTFNRSMIEQQGTTILIAETCNFGSRGTADPVPFVDANGTPIKSDGFIIGFDDSNFDSKGAKYVTRLAFDDSKGGNFTKNGQSRHEGGIHVLYIDGHFSQMKPDGALIKLDAQGHPLPPWSTPPSLLRRQ